MSRPFVRLGPDRVQVEVAGTMGGSGDKPGKMRGAIMGKYVKIIVFNGGLNYFLSLHG